MLVLVLVVIVGMVVVLSLVLIHMKTSRRMTRYWYHTMGRVTHTMPRCSGYLGAMLPTAETVHAQLMVQVWDMRSH